MISNRSRINIPAAIAITIIGVAAIVSIAAYVYFVNKGKPQPFYFERMKLGQRLLDEVNSYDLAGAYPESAEDVIHLNNLIMRLLYGQIAADKGLIWDLVGLQRQLLSDELTAKNSHESQYNQLVEDLENLFASNVLLYDIEVGVVFNSNERDMCSVPLTFTMIHYDKLYWNYIMKRENGRWKIHDFKRTDSSFINIIEE